MPKKRHRHVARSQGRSKKNRKSSRPAEPALESVPKFMQVEVPSKGQGLVAATRLLVGTVVVQESPLITANDGPFREREVVAKFRRLSDEQKNQGGDSIDVWYLGCKLGTILGITSVIGHKKIRHVSKLQT